MGDKSKIEWTEATFNPWWGCTKISPGCDHCYAERDSKRFAPGLWGVDGGRRLFGDAHWNQPFTWNARAQRAGKRMRVFCASMADVFDNHPAVTDERERLWRVIEETPMLDWQLLTKRVSNVAKMVPPTWMLAGFPPNVWMGISVVNQEEADRDVPKLLRLPVRVRWLSCEPLLGPIDLRSHLEGHCTLHDFAGGFCVQRDHPEVQRLGWVVVGGESGPKARPMHPEWARSLRDQCAAAGVPHLFKQWGEWLPCGMVTDQPHNTNRSPPGAEIDGHRFVRIGKRAAGRLLDGRTWDEYPSRVAT